MRRIAIATTVFVVGGLAAAGGAAAAEPEMGVCVKQSEGAAFSNAKCTKSATGSKARYAWKTEIAKPGFTITARRVEIQSHEHTHIACTSASGEGHYFQFGTEGVVITFKGCALTELEGKQPPENPECSSEGAASGEVTTEPRGGELGISANIEGTKEGALGLEIVPKLSAATCAGVTTQLFGEAIGLMTPAAKMTSKSKLKFAVVELEGNERQNPFRFVGQPNEVLELCVEFCSQAVVRGVFSITNEEPVEANPAARRRRREAASSPAGAARARWAAPRAPPGRRARPSRPGAVPAC